MNSRGEIYAALIHHPVLDKNGEEITSAIANMDIHDLARLAKTYGMGGLYVVTPDKNQSEIAQKIISHWVEGYGSTYNNDRMEALKLVKIVASIEEMEHDVESLKGKKPLLVSTSASKMRNSVSFEELRAKIPSGIFIILFGTGWGLGRRVIEQSDYVLEPVEMNERYNHLSVRSAASIIVDRLLG